MAISLSNFVGQSKEEQLRITETRQTFFKTLMNAYVTNVGVIRGFPASQSVINIQNPRDAFVSEDRLFYASGLNFYLYPTTLLHTLSSDLPLYYTEVNKTIYASNGIDFFKINKTNDVVQIPQGNIDDFKMYLPAGFPVEHHRGRLFSAVGNLLYFSDLWDFEVIDKRYNLIQMPDRIVMIAPTNSGLLIGTDSGIYLISYTTDIREAELSFLSPDQCKSVNYIKHGCIKTIFMTDKGFMLYTESGLVSERLQYMTLNRQEPILNYKRLQYLNLPYAQLVAAYDLRR